MPRRKSRINVPAVATTAFLAAFCVWLWLTLPAPPHRFIQEYDGWGFAEQGEALLHGVRPEWDPIRMPLSSVPAALSFSHLDFTARDWTLASESIEVLMIMAGGSLLLRLESLLGPAALAVLALARGGAYPPAHYADSSHTLLILLVGLLIVWRAQAPSLARTLALALAMGASLLFRSSLAFFPPLLAFFELLRFHRGSLKACWKHLALLAIVPYVFLLPWIGMNWKVHGEFIPFEHRSAAPIIVGGAIGLVQGLEGRWQALVDEPIDTASTREVLAWAGRQVLSHPGRYIAAYAKRLRYVFSLHPLLFLLAISAVWVWRDRREFLEFGLLPAYLVWVHCLMTVVGRYFEPLWPLLALLAAAFAARFWKPQKPRTDSTGYRAAALLARGLLAAVMVLCLHTQWVVGSYARKAHGPQAEKALAGEIARHPRDAWLLRERARRRLMNDDLAGAAEDLSRAVELEPENIGPALTLAWVTMLRGDPSGLLAWRSPPESTSDMNNIAIDAHIFKAHAYLRDGRAGKAREHLEAAVERKKRMSAVHGPQTPSAKSAVEKMRSGEEGIITRARRLLENRPIKERLALSGVLAGLSPSSSRLVVEQAELSLRAGDRALALRLLSKAGAMSPSAGERHRTALLYQQLKEYRPALAILDDLVLADPGNAVVLKDKAISLYLNGATDDAVRVLEKAIEADPGLLAAYLTLGTIHAARGRPGEAVALFDRALRKPPNEKDRQVRESIEISRREMLAR